MSALSFQTFALAMESCVHPGVPTKVIAGSFGLSGFAIALFAGLAAGNPAEVVLLRGVVSMIVCNVLGWVVGAVAERTLEDGIKSYQLLRPVPEARSGTRPPVDDDVLEV